MLRQIAPIRKSRARLRLGPDDAGRRLTYEQYDRARYVEGYDYEIIEGVLIVSPTPIPWHEHWVSVVANALRECSRGQAAGINRVSTHLEVYVPNRKGPTRPQPDVAAFRNYPTPPPARWDDVCPLIVVEIVSPRHSKKDTERNRELYWSASGIAEYWIVDPSESWDAPSLTVLIRRPDLTDWEEKVVPFGKTYRTAALPGFSLNLKSAQRE